MIPSVFLKPASWPEPNRQPGSLQEERLPESSLPPKLPGSQLLPRVEWRSPTGTGPAPLPSGRSGGTRSQQSCSSGSFHSSGWSVRSPRTSRRTWGSRALPWWPCRRPARPTWSGCSRTPTFAPSMPSVSPSCPRTSSLQGGSEENAPKKQHLNDPKQSHRPFSRPTIPLERDF